MAVLNRINRIIQEDNNCNKKIKYLHLASGQTLKELVPSIMKLLLKKSVSIQFSGCGRRNKRNFSATKIAGAVNDIILQKYPHSSKDEISKRISKFLAESGDREGGRKERDSKQQI